MPKNLPLIALGAILLASCANSADHEVVVKSSSTDQFLSCPEIRSEIFRVQAIKDGVQRDKDDMTGSDIVDGLLWFPFNVLVKHSNYSNANEAADARISNLRILSNQKDCGETTATEETNQSDIVQRLTALKEMKDSGLITTDEYVQKREDILNDL